MAGLYSKNNLAEVQLNMKDGLQKLYKTGIQEDLRLFAFANAIFSEVRSGVTKTDATTGTSTVVENEIAGLINEPFTNEAGNVINRTKFVTNSFTFSSDNLIYFEKIGDFGFDQRPGFFDVAVQSNAGDGSSQGTLQFPTGTSVTSLNRIIGNDNAVYYVLDDADPGEDFRISLALNGNPLLGTDLSDARDNITVAGGAKIRIGRPEGAPVVVSKNGSIVAATVVGSGSGYEIERTDRPGGFASNSTYTISEVGNFDWVSIGGPVEADAAPGVQFTTADISGVTQDNATTGSAIRILPTASPGQKINVNVRGERSGAENAIIQLTIVDGKISKLIPVVIISGGSGYYDDEALIPIKQCRLNRFNQQETPELYKCKNYSAFQDRLIHRSFKYTVPSAGDEIDYDTAVLGYEGTIAQTRYFYQTKDAGEDGFFLYDPVTQQDLYLGAKYNSLYSIPTTASTPSLTLKRFDTITALNLLNIDSLNSQSRINDYDDNVFSVSDSLGSQIRSLTQTVENIRVSFKTLFQNNKRQRLITDEKNTLGTQFNIFEGKSFDSTFRLILRDPDGVLDRTDITFNDLNALEAEDAVEITLSDQIYHCPGMYIRVGSSPEGEPLYKRAFSTDDKPFSSAKGKVYLSPILNKLSSGDYATGSFAAVASSGENKYSISTAYLRSGGSYVKGFVSNIGTIIQNLSENEENGGFVYHRALDVVSIGNVVGYPLFDYYDGASLKSNIRSPRVLVG